MLFYFSYGSNMSVKRLTHRVPSARVHAVGNLTHHQLHFHKSSRDGSAKCNVALSDDPRDCVIGVVFTIKASEKIILDRIEGLGCGYKVKTVSVALMTGEVVDAFIYIADDIDERLLPYHWYKEHVLTGAKENELPDHYVEQIEAVVSIDDPDQARHDLELAIYV